LGLADPPDVAVLDIEMPGLDGWHVADRLRAGGVTAVVFLTANTEAPARKKAIERKGVLVGKPFNPVELPDLVRLLARRRTP
jgi:DNA-binding response OmpR family regulator